MVESIDSVNNVVYVCFAFLGLGFLLPWNSIITAVDYLNEKFPGEHIEFKIAFSYMIVNFVAMTSGMFFKLAHRAAVKVRLLLGFTLLLLILLITPFVETVNAVMFLSALAGVGDAVTQLSVFGYAGSFPPIYTAGVMNGNGVAGLLVAVLRIVTKASFSSDVDGLRDGSRVYFFISGVIVIIAMVCVIVLHRSEFVQANYARKNAFDSDQDSTAPGVELLEEGGGDSETHPGTDADGSDQPTKEYHRARRESVSAEAVPAAPGPASPMKWIFNRIRLHAISVWLTFSITLMLFPGVTSEMTSSYGIGSWFSVILMSIFMLFDYIGRVAPSYKPLVFFSSGPAILKAACSRLVFIPLMLLSLAAQKSDGGGSWFGNDIVTYFIMALFAVSNGYVSSLSMMFGSAQVPAHMQEDAGMLMAVCLVFGLTVGASTGFGISQSLS